MSKRRRLGDWLVDNAVITQTQLEEALRIQKKEGNFLGQILLDKDWVSDEQLCLAISQAIQVDWVNIDTLRIEQDIIHLVSSSLAMTCNILPISVDQEVLHLAMENPSDISVIQIVEYSTGMPVKALVAPSRQLRKAINNYYQIDTSSEKKGNLFFLKEFAAIRKNRAQKIQMLERKRLGSFLVKTGVISQAQLTKALAIQEEKTGFLGQLLVDLGWLTEEQLCQSLAEMLQIESVNIDDAQIDRKVIHLIPDSLAASCNVLPLFVDHKILYLAMENPLDIAVIQLIQYQLAIKVEPLVASLSQIRKYIPKYYDISNKDPYDLPNDVSWEI